jgi:hypothetical protein
MPVYTLKLGDPQFAEGKFLAASLKQLSVIAEPECGQVVPDSALRLGDIDSSLAGQAIPIGHVPLLL